MIDYIRKYIVFLRLEISDTECILFLASSPVNSSICLPVRIRGFEPDVVQTFDIPMEEESVEVLEIRRIRARESITHPSSAPRGYLAEEKS